MIEVDGGYLEGGGQILRTAIALSAIARKPVRIFDIRKGREKPGLRPQHLQGISAAAQMCHARIEGLDLNSTNVTFMPGRIKGGRYVIDTKTAGAITLILQTLVPIGLFADSPLELVLRGGTAVPFSPTIGYFTHVLEVVLRKLGVNLEVQVKRHGFYPKGGGEVEVKIIPSDMTPLNVRVRGSTQRIYAWVVASHHLKKANVAERMGDGFSSMMNDAEIEFTYVDAISPGCFITAIAPCENTILGTDALGKRGKPAERVGMDGAKDLMKAINSDTAVDEWMVDQLIPFMALATQMTGEQSAVNIPALTQHAQTNIWVVQKFLNVVFNTENNVLTCRKSM
jgi:RNA 3'-phosphate cyclase